LLVGLPASGDRHLLVRVKKNLKRRLLEVYPDGSALDWACLEKTDSKNDSDFAGRFGFMVEAGLRFFSRAAALRLTFRPPWV
jgi:hypothetical protein